MSVYSNTEIKKAIADGTIISIPFNEDNVSEASLDFTLGYYYYDVDSSRVKYNPFDPAQIPEVFGSHKEAKPYREYNDDYRYFVNIPKYHPVIILEPGQRILAHTHEFIGIRHYGGAAEVRSRSTWGRNGVAICFDAGWVDPGYFNRITLEIYNLNKFAIILPVGERIGQMVFHHTLDVEGKYSEGRDGMSGKYQQSDDIDTVIANWRPHDMLPRAFKDTRKMPEKIDGLTVGYR